MKENLCSNSSRKNLSSVFKCFEEEFVIEWLDDEESVFKWVEEESVIKRFDKNLSVLKWFRGRICHHMA